MTAPSRYAIYHLPPPGPLADFAAAWLGWDCATGHEPPSPDFSDLPAPVRPRSALTEDPRRYGFHATLKAPFRLAPGQDEAGLDRAITALAARLAPVDLPGLTLSRLGRFLALVPEAPSPALQDLAARCVRDLDPFRAPLTPEEIARRRPDRLTERQRALLDRWGYPHVLEEFRFHMTLTGPLEPVEAEPVQALLADQLPPLPRPYPIADICLLAEGPDRRFRVLRRYPLTSSRAT